MRAFVCVRVCSSRNPESQKEEARGLETSQTQFLGVKTKFLVQGEGASQGPQDHHTLSHVRTQAHALHIGLSVCLAVRNASGSQSAV